MQDFLTFCTALLQAISEFLMSEPIIWFVGVILLSAVISIVIKIIKIGGVK